MNIKAFGVLGNASHIFKPYLIMNNPLKKEHPSFREKD